MRIDLNVPFSEKDEARILGARWDAGRRTWYVKDMEDLTPFQRWLKKPQSSCHEVQHVPLGSRERQKVERRLAKLLAPVCTQSVVHVPHCGCTDVPPWEDCVHTWEATELDEDSARHLRSI